MKNLIFTLFSLCFTTFCCASVYQWSVKLDGYISNETDQKPEAFLWIPPGCERLDAIVFIQQNMSEETLFDMSSFRDAMSELNFAIIWIAPGFSQQWDVNQGAQKIFDKMISDLADKSGYEEIKEIPYVPIGHSAMATFPWNFAAWNKDKTLAVVSLHGDAPRTNLTGYGRENLEWGRNRNIDGVPGLMIEGEYEWWEARVNPALSFRMMYPGSCISFLCDAGRGHFDVSVETAQYISLFLKKAAQYRLKNNKEKECKLLSIDPTTGYLVQRWSPDKLKRARPASFSEYKGDTHDAFWYFDKEIALLTEQRYNRTKNKKMQYVSFSQNGKLLEFNEKNNILEKLSFLPLEDGITFNLKPVFTDSTYKKLSENHAQTIPVISRVCGPVEIINDTTFRLSFYRMGLTNKKRTAAISLLAEAEADKKYKDCVHHISLGQ